jgi:hypothetical protein
MSAASDDTVKGCDLFAANLICPAGFCAVLLVMFRSLYSLPLAISIDSTHRQTAEEIS